MPTETTLRPFRPGVTIGVAVAGWLAAWFLGNVLGQAVVAVTGHSGETAPPTWVFALAALALWAPMVAMVVAVGRSLAGQSLRATTALRFRPIDALGVPIGVAVQFIVIPVLYAPLRRAWPSTFNSDAVERNARRLFDTAHGGWMVVLVVIVVIGAPLVEELVYRGLIHRTLSSRFGRFGTSGRWLAVLISAAFFAVIHFRPVEYLGLFVVGVVLAVCVELSGRLGMSIVTHMAFNAAALLAVARR